MVGARLRNAHEGCGKTHCRQHRQNAGAIRPPSNVGRAMSVGVATRPELLNMLPRLRGVRSEGRNKYYE